MDFHDRYSLHMVHLDFHEELGAVNLVFEDGPTSVLAGNWDNVTMKDIGLRVDLPSGTVSRGSAEEARRSALRAIVSRIDDAELEKLFEDVARANRRTGFGDAIDRLRKAGYCG